MATLGDEDVCGFNVAVDDAFSVRGIEAVGDLDRDGKQALNIKRIRIDEVLESDSLKVFHHDERLIALPANFINRANARVIQGRSSARFAAKAFQDLCVRNHFVWKKLERNEAAELSVLRFVHHTHSTAPQFLQDAVVRNCLADHWERSC